jgi:flagellar export protein FliJ
VSERYPLQVLRELRETERDDARAALAAAVGEVARSREQVDAVRASIAACQQRLRDATRRERDRLESAFDLSMVGRMQDFARAIQAEVESLEQDLAHANAALREARRAEEQARAVLVEAEQSLEAVEKHHEKWQRDEAVNQRRKRSAAMDEIALARWKEDKT